MPLGIVTIGPAGTMARHSHGYRIVMYPNLHETLQGALLVAALALAGCFGQSDTDRMDLIRGDFELLLESKDQGAILRHLPEDVTRMRISTGSGRNVSEPESVEDVEEALEDVRHVFSADTIELTQQNVELSGSRATMNLTYRIATQGWEKLLPVRMDLDNQDGTWVLRSIQVFD